MLQAALVTVRRFRWPLLALQGCPGTIFGGFGHDCPVAPSGDALPALRGVSGATLHLPGGAGTALRAFWARAA